MISANELRRGNVIMFDDGSNQIVRVDWMFYHLDQWFVQWDDLSGGSLEKGNSFLMDFLPIPLTPEILWKCGVSTDVYGHMYFEAIKSDDFRNLFISFSFKKNEITVSVSLSPLPNIQHLHQLQNLYFALTGQELNYQP